MLGERGRLLGFLGPLCLYEGLLGTNGYGRQWDCLLLRWGGGGFQGWGGVLDLRESWVDWVCWVWVGRESWGLRGLGAFGYVWGGWCGGVMALEGLKHRGWAGGDCDFGCWMMTNLRLKRPEEICFAFCTFVRTQLLEIVANFPPF